MAVDSPSFRAIAEYVHAVTGIVLELERNTSLKTASAPSCAPKGSATPNSFAKHTAICPA